jgi:DNA polymerase I-like protein with 3'-5' exonuclease and polymerase domains
VRAAGQYLACIGLAIEVDHSITVPLCGPDRDAMRREIARLLATSNDKVTQNGISFDLPWLRREGFVINGRLFDTRAMHHALDPRGNHDLAEMASIYTRQPYWKHEAGQYVFGDKLQRYCGLDTCVTLELFFTFHDLLHDAGLWEFYLRHYVDLAPALLDMTMHGIGVDRARMVAERQRLDADMQRLIAEITEEAGMPLVAKTGLSNDRLKFYLFGAKGFPGVRGEKTYAKLAATYPNAKCLNLPPKWKKNTKGDSSVTTDEVALRTLILKYPDKLGSIGPKLLDLRDKKKMAEFLEESMIDSDGRVRCSFSFVTEAGRLASAATPWGTGRNLMNIPHGARSVFVPDEGQG